jgi:hypothetical protein
MEILQVVSVRNPLHVATIALLATVVLVVVTAVARVEVAVAIAVAVATLAAVVVAAALLSPQEVEEGEDCSVISAALLLLRCRKWESFIVAFRARTNK